MCKICKQNYHGEKKNCEDQNKLEEWTKEKLGVEIGKCP